MNVIETTSTERKLAERINPGVTGALAVSDRAGGIAFVSMDQVLEFAKLMAISSVAIPKHLRGNAGACLAICIQALEWQMSPYSVANKSYSVNDRLAYEAQLIEAVILRRAPIKGRPKIEYKGDGERRVCRVWAELRDEPGEIVEYTSPPFGRITPKNSPLWKADPDQQHFYYSVRAFCRRHFPDVLLGVYARDELDDSEPFVAAVGVTPDAPRRRPSAMAALDKWAASTGETGGEPPTDEPPPAQDADDPGDPRPGDDTVIEHTAGEESQADPEPTVGDLIGKAQRRPPKDPDIFKLLVRQIIAAAKPEDASMLNAWWKGPNARALRNAAQLVQADTDELTTEVNSAIEGFQA